MKFYEPLLYGLLMLESPLLLGLYDTAILFRVAGQYAEKLMEFEEIIILDSLLKHVPHLEGHDLKSREVGIRVGIAEMVLLPVFLCLLLHHVVPSVDLLFVEIVKKVEGSSGKRQNASIRFSKTIKYSGTHDRFGAFVRLIYYDHVPVIVHHVALQFVIVPCLGFLLMFTILNQRAKAKILHGDKIDHLALTFIHLLANFVEVTFGGVLHSGCIDIVATLTEDFFKILFPAIVNHGTVSDNQGRLIILLLKHCLGHLQSAQGLAETHLGIPKELAVLVRLHGIVAGEVFYGLVDCGFLFRTEHDVGLLRLCTIETLFAVQDGIDGAGDDADILHFKPEISGLVILFAVDSDSIDRKRLPLHS